MASKHTNYLLPVAIIAAVVVVIVGINLYLNSITPAQIPQQGDGSSLANKEGTLQRAPELQGISGYINTESGLTIQKLTDEKKVVLVDFWTYSCINCQRTTPYLNAWYDKYSDDGLVIIGVHTPEFAFEKDYNNVLDAVNRFKIKYPVVQDNDFQTWRAYDNRYWPRKYLIDSDGFIVYDHIGEGSYDETEKKIQEALDERAAKLGIEKEMDKNMSSPEGVQEIDPSQINTPEIYFGYNFLFGRNYWGNHDLLGQEAQKEYEIPQIREPNLAYVSGNWYGSGDYIQLKGESGKIVLRYYAKSVNIVAGGNGSIKVMLDGKDVSDSESGKDVSSGTAAVNGERLYNLVSSDSYGEHEIEIEITGDVRVYTFTFG